MWRTQSVKPIHNTEEYLHGILSPLTVRGKKKPNNH
jgi:hypothetical protein